MNSQTRIIVIKLKDLVFKALLVVLAIVLILFLIISFSNKSTETSASVSNSKYTAGVYTSQVTLNGNSIDIQVTVDKDNINDIKMVNVAESVATMYPLIQSSFDEIAAKVCETGSTKNITYSSENKYTATILLKAIQTALDKCTIN